MADKTTFIRTDRNKLEWRWFKQPYTAHLFEALLLLANYESRTFEDIVVPRGALVTSIAKLSEITGLSQKSVRTSLNRLIRTNEVAKKSTQKYTLIFINNYEKYQGEGAYTSANEGQTNGKQSANEGQQSKKGRKEERKNNNINARTREAEKDEIAAVAADFWPDGMFEVEI